MIRHLFENHDLVKLDAGIRHAAERGDRLRVIELRLQRGDDVLDIAADLAAQEG